MKYLLLITMIGLVGCGAADQRQARADLAERLRRSPEVAREMSGASEAKRRFFQQQQKPPRMRASGWQ
jgi:hypothetical protein